MNPPPARPRSDLSAAPCSTPVGVNGGGTSAQETPGTVTD